MVLKWQTKVRKHTKRIISKGKCYVEGGVVVVGANGANYIREKTRSRIKRTDTREVQQ